MLTTNMAEGMRGKVKLTHRDANEFRLFYGMLHMSTTRPITKETVNVLRSWADEYQVETLKKQCEDFLISNVHGESQEELVHALK